MANVDTDDTEPEMVGSWTAETGNKLYMIARRGTAYASIWLDRRPEPARIGRVKRAGQRVCSVEWDEPWSNQSAAWKDAQRAQIANALARWGTAEV